MQGIEPNEELSLGSIVSAAGERVITLPVSAAYLDQLVGTKGLEDLLAKAEGLQ
jgi:hypothetical protein